MLKCLEKCKTVPKRQKLFFILLGLLTIQWAVNSITDTQYIYVYILTCSFCYFCLLVELWFSSGESAGNGKEIKWCLSTMQQCYRKKHYQAELLKELKWICLQTVECPLDFPPSLVISVGLTTVFGINSAKHFKRKLIFMKPWKDVQKILENRFR